jgi:amidohydrolase
MELKNIIETLSSEYLEEVIAIRRHLHAHPELSFKEYNTSKFITGKLNEWGIAYQEGIVETGVVALICGTKSQSGKVVALRADMDALPIEETNKVAYQSKNKGVMHACGHDVHTASLLGVAKILHQLQSEFSGTIKLIFQPGEEQAPGGASLMIKEGVLENPQPHAIFAQHVFPSLQVGKVGFRSGKYMASTDEMYLTITGKGGHAALRGSYINPLLIASTILLALEKLFSEPNLVSLQPTHLLSETIPTVVAFGKITGKGATNVIPDEVTIEGTFRTMNEQWRKLAHAIIKDRCDTLAREMGGGCTTTIVQGYPALVNDETTTLQAMSYAQEYVGNENVVELEHRMTGEDFSFFAEKIPACFYRLGTGNKEKGITSNVHTPTFNIDEQALKTGMGLMAWIALRSLENE